MRSAFCWLVRRRLDAYRDGELPPAIRARVERHVGRCEACGGELAGLDRLRAVLAADAVEVPEADWSGFWPRIRTRLETGPAPPEPVWRRLWVAVGSRPRLALAPAAAAAALAVLAMVAPWQRTPQEPVAPGPARPPLALTPPGLDQVVIQSIETDDPDVPVMVYASPESDVTVLWVFGLERTGV